MAVLSQKEIELKKKRFNKIYDMAYAIATKRLREETPDNYASTQHIYEEVLSLFKRRTLTFMYEYTMYRGSNYMNSRWIRAIEKEKVDRDIESFLLGKKE